MKRFTILTLIDITESRQYRREFNKETEWAQQQNFQMLIQSIGMRVNPLYSKSPLANKIDITSLDFGKKFNGMHKVWSFEFEIEYEDGLKTDTNPIGLLLPLLNFVPCATNLSETAIIFPEVFDTMSEISKNTIVQF